MALKKYPFDVFDSLERRCQFLYRRPGPLIIGRGFESDIHKIGQRLSNGEVDLIVTSPPYLRVVRYGKYNWIRLWLLNETVEDVDRKVRIERSDHRLGLSDQLSLRNYVSFVGDALEQCNRVLKPGGTCVMVIGDVTSASRGTTLNLAAHVWSSVRRETSLRLVDILEDQIDVSRKVTRIWGNRKGGATQTDRMLVLRKPGGRRFQRPAPLEIINRLRSDVPLISP